MVDVLLKACGSDEQLRQALLLAQDKDHMTALHWASRNGHVLVVEVLLKACGSNKELKGALLQAKDKDHMTALNWARYHGHVHVEDALLKASGFRAGWGDRGERVTYC